MGEAEDTPVQGAFVVIEFPSAYPPQQESVVPGSATQDVLAVRGGVVQPYGPVGEQAEGRRVLSTRFIAVLQVVAANLEDAVAHPRAPDPKIAADPAPGRYETIKRTSC